MRAIASSPNDRKVWFNFEEGGACWDAISGRTYLCTESVDGGYSLSEGLFDRMRDDNPLRNFTIVNALYCSGDAFVSNNKQQSWKAGNGELAVQAGQQNVMATIEWLQAQRLDAPLSSLLVAGQSAGSLGAQAWSNALIQLFPADTQTVMPDSCEYFSLRCFRVHPSHAIMWSCRGGGCQVFGARSACRRCLTRPRLVSFYFTFTQILACSPRAASRLS